jgi:hypothetical protein
MRSALTNTGRLPLWAEILGQGRLAGPIPTGNDDDSSFLISIPLVYSQSILKLNNRYMPEETELAETRPRGLAQ